MYRFLTFLVALFVAFSLVYLGAHTNVISNVLNMTHPTSPAQSATTSTADQVSGASNIVSDSLEPNAHDILYWTNWQREQQGEQPLAENNTLDAAALTKTKDMFAKQYFEHTSPTGVGIEQLEDNAGYAYIVIGENLAEGTFKTGQEIVTAWMHSPGHRANILKPSYQEIGIAVMQGQYQGRMVWMAVQEFGTPLSQCPEPSDATKTAISTDQDQIHTLENEANSLKTTLDSMDQHDPSYNQTVSQYNGLADSINTLSTTLQGLVNTYNAQVESFNSCTDAIKNAVAPTQ